MKKVQSKDGTAIAYDESGTGPTVILVSGAFGFRLVPPMVQLAELLAKHFTVINYDRRGRGDSGDTPPYAIEREIEDIEALIKEAGGFAHLWGWSSGAVLALRAAASGLNVRKLALYEPPFMVSDDGFLPPADLETRLEEMLASNRRADAVKFFMTKAMGVPALFVALMRLMPMWSKLKAVAHTLPYDFAVMGDTMQGKPLSADPWASVTAPTLVMVGEKSEAFFHHAAQALTDVLPNGRQRTLEGQGHNVAMKFLTPVLVEYFNA